MKIFAVVPFAVFLGAHGVNARRGYGFVGYGIHYEQPGCAFACRESISGATLKCSVAERDTADSGMSGMDSSSSTISTDSECYATDDVFLQTLALCVATRCSSLPVWKIERFWKANVAGSDDMQPDPKETYQQALAKVSGTPSVEYSGSGALNETSIVPYEVWHPNYVTDVAFDQQESQQVRYGFVILLSGFLIPIGFSLLRFLPFPRLWRSKFYAWAIEPPLFGTKHDTPVFYGLMQMPTRGQALFILYLTTINTVLSAVHYNNATSNTWFSGNQWRWMMMLVSNRLGLLSFANLPLVVLYGGRNNVLLWLTDWSHSTFLLLHRWIAAIATLQAILHSLMYLHIYVRAGTHNSEARQPYWYWGIVGTLGMVVLFPTSVVRLRRKCYELFLAWHVVVSVLVIAGCYWHIVFEFSHKWGYETWLFICMAIWGFDRVFRVLRLARVGVRTATIQAIDDDYVRVTIPHARGRGHAYVYFPTLTWRVWENHPFSVASSVLPAAAAHHPSTTSATDAVTASSEAKDSLSSMEPSNGDVEKQSHVARRTGVGAGPDGVAVHRQQEGWQVGFTLYIRTQRGLTALLQNRASAPVLVETGYASASPLSETLFSSPVIIGIAGGVGFTAVLPHLMAHSGRAKLYWGCRTKSLVEEARSAFDLSRIEMEAFIGERMNIRAILDAELSDNGSGGDEVCVIVCGPESMTDEARTVVNSIARKSKRTSVRLVVESFTW